MPPVHDAHALTVLNALRAGRLVPFLGAGVNRCGRPHETRWQAGLYLPDGPELADELASEHDIDSRSREDLLRVSEYVALTAGTGPLCESLHRIFDHDYPPTAVHRFFASMPRQLRAMGSAHPHQFIITTNFDDLMERAFAAEGEPLDVLKYIAEGKDRGRFVHIDSDGRASPPIEKANEYVGLPIDAASLSLQRSILVKIHGAVDRSNADQDSYVITEDHYIDYLTRTNLRSLMPSMLVAKLQKVSFLFLAYGLRDWNLRAILRQIRDEQKFNYQSWAIQLSPEPLDQKFWAQHGVEVIDAQLEQYMERLEQRVRVELAETASGDGTRPTAGAA